MIRAIWMALAAAALAFPLAATAQIYGQQPGGQYGAPGYNSNTRTITCASTSNRRNRCPVPRDWDAARLVQQISSSPCTFGRSWGFDPGSVWVDNGCRARFAAAPRGGGGWRPGPDWNQNFAMSCGSPQYQRNFCQVDVGARGSVRLQRQLSDTRCVENRNWGFNRAGIWVDKGCSAQFLVMRRW